MYTEYYGLARAPFEMTPDPSFLYLGEAHREGLATLVYAVNSGKGFVMLTGEVGTGKTTLLHALLGQLDSTTNSAFIFNPRLDPIGCFRMLFEELGIGPPCESKAEYLLKRVDLADRMKNFPHQLSGGEKQRVALCRALINKPQIVFADEPTGNLDSVNSRTTLRLLLELREEMKTTLLLATHNREISSKSNHILRLSDGRIETFQTG